MSDGEPFTPLAYQQGWIEYRGRRFFVDERAFITDPETGFMLDAVIAYLRSTNMLDRGALVAELGTGCGAIGISLLKELSGVRVIGLEVDPGAIEVAKRNITAHGVDYEILRSDFFSAWDDRPQPAVIFGDLPWGDDSSVYEADRPLEHYLAMPYRSVFPVGGPMGMHRRALESVKRLGWSSEVFLNCGMLPREAVLAMARSLGAAHVQAIVAASNVFILRCRMN